MQIILQDDSMFMKEQEYYSQMSIHLQFRCIFIHKSCLFAFSLIDVVTSVVL